MVPPNWFQPERRFRGRIEVILCVKRRVAQELENLSVILVSSRLIGQVDRAAISAAIARIGIRCFL